MPALTTNHLLNRGLILRSSTLQMASRSQKSGESVIAVRSVEQTNQSKAIRQFCGNTNSLFALDYISGALTLNGPLDRENPFYSAGFILTVKGTELNDDRSPSNATVMTTFNILVIDLNDNAPEFNSSEYSVAIPELAQVGFALPLFIQVQDKDEMLHKKTDIFFEFMFLDISEIAFKENHHDILD
uniref:Uncharacterized protein n=1 Tax=Sphaerodactylus townsendi TaxID=933632 RepID=A0ACB8F9P8_9SAUR